MNIYDKLKIVADYMHFEKHLHLDWYLIPKNYSYAPHNWIKATALGLSFDILIPVALKVLPELETIKRLNNNPKGAEIYDKAEGIITAIYHNDFHIDGLFPAVVDAIILITSTKNINP